MKWFILWLSITADGPFGIIHEANPYTSLSACETDRAEEQKRVDGRHLKTPTKVFCIGNEAVLDAITKMMTK